MKVSLIGTNKFISVRCYRKFKMYGHWWGVHGQLYKTETGKIKASKENYRCSCCTNGAYIDNVYGYYVVETVRLSKKSLIKVGKTKVLKAIARVLQKQKQM